MPAQVYRAHQHYGGVGREHQAKPRRRTTPKQDEEHRDRPPWPWLAEPATQGLAGDEELVEFFETCRDEETARAQMAKTLLAERLEGGDFEGEDEDEDDEEASDEEDDS